MDARLNSYEEKMVKTMHSLEEEFGSIRAGRANPHVLDKLRVDYYGTPSPIQSVANVSVPEPRMIQIQPWEASLVKEIEKGLNIANQKGLAIMIGHIWSANTLPNLLMELYPVLVKKGYRFTTVSKSGGLITP